MSNQLVSIDRAIGRTEGKVDSMERTLAAFIEEVREDRQRGDARTRKLEKWQNWHSGAIAVIVGTITVVFGVHVKT